MNAVTVRSPRTFELRSWFRPRFIQHGVFRRVDSADLTFYPKFEAPGGGIHPEFAVVDSTMDMINYRVAEQLASKENSQ